MKKDKALVLAAAAAAIFASANANASHHEGAKGGHAAVACTGVHSCSGKSVCKGHGNASCAGKNSCGGHGFIKIVTGDKAFSEELCKKLGGEAKEYTHDMKDKKKKKS